MKCVREIQSVDEEFLFQLDDRISSERIPLTGSIDITHGCNLNCVHCYLGDRGDRGKGKGRELETDKWFSVIDEIADVGCLFLLISGGEPILREDFPEIYTHAKKKGILVSVFSNGTMINDTIIDLFKDLPPHDLEVSLYGGTEETCDRITRVKGSFRQCIKGIEKLTRNNIKFSLKTIFMTLNRHEMDLIESISRDYGAEFRFDAAIFPCFNGDQSPIHLRVSPGEAVEREFRDEDTFRLWKKYYEKTMGAIVSNELYQCGTGISTFHIDPYGNLQPCQLVNGYSFNLRNGSFNKGWQEKVSLVNELKASSMYKCNHCERMSLCGLCPAFFELETGSAEIYSEYLCEMGYEREKRLKA